MRDGETEGLSGPEVHCEIERRRLLDRQIGQFATFQKTIYIVERSHPVVKPGGSIREQATGLHELGVLADGWQICPKSKLSDTGFVHPKHRGERENQGAGTVAFRGLERGLEILRTANVDGLKFQTQKLRRALQRIELGVAKAGVPKRCHFRNLGQSLFQNLESLRDEHRGRDGLESIRRRGKERECDAGARPPAPPGRILLAVLPFDNYTGDPEQDYFVGGLTEEVIAQLGRLNPERLGVIARTSTASYKAAAKPIELMGEELGVDYAVEGSFRRENERVRITVQLIDVRDRTHTWVEDYEKRLDSVLQLQTEVANLISRSLALKLLDRPEAPTRVSGTSNALAYEAYLTGRYFREQITESGFRKGIEYFERAIAEDPAFAQAYSGLAGCYCLLGGHGLEVELPSDVLPRARKEAEAALELSESIEEAHGVLGMISLKYDWDFEEAERQFRRATDLNPSYAQGFLWYSLYYEVTGQTGEAIAKARRARDLNPLSLAANMNLAQQYYRAGRHGEAVQQLEKVLELNPNFWGAHWILGDIHQQEGSYREAIAALSKAAFLSDNNPVSLGSLGFTYGRAGEEKLARAMLAGLEELAEERYVSPFNLAIVHLGLGEKDKAMEKLEEGHRLRSRSMAWLNVDTRLEPLRDDPRFQSLLQRIGFRQ